jgi:hypothetical protein
MTDARMRRLRWLRLGRAVALAGGLLLGAVAAGSLAAALGVTAPGWSEAPAVPDAAVWLGLMAAGLSLLCLAVSYRLHRDLRDA